MNKLNIKDILILILIGLIIAFILYKVVLQPINKLIFQYKLKNAESKVKDEFGDNYLALDPKKQVIQSNYGRFLINQNDNMISTIYNTDIIINAFLETNDTDLQMELSDNLNDIILQHAFLLKELEELPPNKSNKDYEVVYDKIMEAHAFYSQGLIVQLDYMLGNKTSVEFEQGEVIINTIGSVMLELNEEVNKVRGTNYSYTFGYNKDIDVPIKNKE